MVNRYLLAMGIIANPSQGKKLGRIYCRVLSPDCGHARDTIRYRKSVLPLRSLALNAPGQNPIFHHSHTEYHS
jgi:hypothetical protein